MRAASLCLLVGLAIGPAMAQQAYKPGPDNITFPADYATRFIRYATVDKAERKIIRYLYVNPESFAAAKKGEPLPDGTVLIMEDHAARLGPDGTPLLDQQNRFIANPAVTAVFIQEKHAGWGEGYPETIRNGNWEYARFAPDGTRVAGSMEPCLACHLKMVPKQDFSFNFWEYVQAKR